MLILVFRSTIVAHTTKIIWEIAPTWRHTTSVPQCVSDTSGTYARRGVGVEGGEGGGRLEINIKMYMIICSLQYYHHP